MNGRAEITGIADGDHGDNSERIWMPQYMRFGDHNRVIWIAKECIQLGEPSNGPHAWANLLRLKSDA